MFKGTRPTFRSLEKLYQNISQEQIFYEYVGIYPDLNKTFTSPFRYDRTPGCRFAWHSGVLYFKDNSSKTDKWWWTCIDVVKYAKQLTFSEAVDFLWTKYSEKSDIVITKKHVSKFTPQIRFEKAEWEENNMFDLSPEILEKELVFKVKNYWIKTKDGWNKNSIHNPNKTLTVAYYFPDTNHVKLYFPNEVENKWYSNCTSNDIFGYHKIKHYVTNSKLLIITKSAKDRLMLDYKLGFASIALQNEGCWIPDDKFFELSVSFEKILILYDNDLPGISAAQKLSEKYNIEYRILDISTKDTYESINILGLENTKKIIYAQYN